MEHIESDPDFLDIGDERNEVLQVPSLKQKMGNNKGHSRMQSGCVQNYGSLCIPDKQKTGLSFLEVGP